VLLQQLGLSAPTRSNGETLEQVLREPDAERSGT